MPAHLTLVLYISVSSMQMWGRPSETSATLLLQPWTEWHLLHPLHRHHTCSYMKRGEKPEGYRQMRPKTFPTSNYSGNSQKMLQEIRNSLRNLSKPPDPPKVDIGGAVKMLPEDPRQQGRCSNPKNPHHKALQEIRKSLMPFANEPSTSGPEVNKHMSLETPCVGFEEVRWVLSCLMYHWGRLLWRNFIRCSGSLGALCLWENYLKNGKNAVVQQACTVDDTKVVTQLAVATCFEPVHTVQVWSGTVIFRCNK